MTYISYTIITKCSNMPFIIDEDVVGEKDVFITEGSKRKKKRQSKNKPNVTPEEEALQKLVHFTSDLRKKKAITSDKTGQNYVIRQLEYLRVLYLKCKNNPNTKEEEDSIKKIASAIHYGINYDSAFAYPGDGSFDIKPRVMNEYDINTYIEIITSITKLYTLWSNARKGEESGLFRLMLMRFYTELEYLMSEWFLEDREFDWSSTDQP